MDIRKNRFVNNNVLFFFLIIFVSFFLRIYNLNFEDYWLDEQASFWVADPSLSFTETLARAKELDRGTSLFYNIILKNFFLIIGYEPSVGRYLPFIFGLVSVPALCYLTFQIRKNYSFLLVGVLTSINFYLISYSQEVRVYSFLFLISIISIILFFKLLESQNGKWKKYLYSFFYILFSLIGCYSHIFFFIIVVSQFSYLFLNFLFYKKKQILVLLSVFIIPLLYLFFMYEYLVLQFNIEDHWIVQINLDFFYNFFFSRFFGSKIMGIIYLSILFYLIYINRYKILKFDNKNFLFILILFFSYFLPLVYGIFNQPILTDRYIIFVLIPIFILISVLILDIKKFKKKYLILFLILTSSLINSYIEIFKREKSKPDFTSSFEHILKSDINNIVAKTRSDIIEKIITNYFKNTKIAKENNLLFFKSSLDHSNLNALWLLCYKPVNGNDCLLNNDKFSSWSKTDQIEYKLVISTLYEKY